MIRSKLRMLALGVCLLGVSCSHDVVAKEPADDPKAIVLVVQETGWKRIAVDESRRLIRASTPVVIAYQRDDRRSPYQLHRLWKEVGSPTPDSEAVWRTFSRILRPGTLVFALSASENVPRP